MINNIMDVLYRVPGIILLMTVHEFAHGFTAYKLGDKTAKSDGRLSLNPMRHIDIIGLLALIVFQFGWAKPVMVNPGNFKNPKIDMALTAAAGPLANIILSLVVVLIYYPLALLTSPVGVTGVIQTIVLQCAVLSLSMGLFNMLPIPPLDGSKIFGAVLPDRSYFRFTSMGNIGMIVIIVLLYTEMISKILYPILLPVLNGMFWIAERVFSFL